MFNQEKFTQLQVEVARLAAEKAGAEAALALAKELYERQLSHVTGQLRDTQEELAQVKGKISLMETIMMPLSSRAGAAYQETLNPKKIQILRPNTEPGSSEWQRYKRQREADLDKEYAQEDQHARKSTT